MTEFILKNRISMKKTKLITIFVLSVVLFSSCITTKSLQKDLRNPHFDLDYDLDTDEYLGTVNQTVYLNFIDNSNMEYYTVVNGNKVLVLPFIFYNYWHKKFNITLGESSLTQPYREFLRDALLAECNRSACFNLENGDVVTAPDSAYILDVKIVHNETKSGIKETNTIIVIPTYYSMFDFTYIGYQALPVSSELEIAVRLLQGNTCLFEKNYHARQEEKVNRNSLVNSLAAADACVDNMTFCLATATKGIVEDISRTLHLIMFSK
jgi:hypothetical protein